MEFDSREAKNLTAGKHITVKDCPGLRLEASNKAGVKAWIYRYKSPVDGRMRQVKIGEWPSMPPFKAAAEWDALRIRRNSGVDLSTELRSSKRAKTAKSASSIYTVRCLCDDYLDKHVTPNRKAAGVLQIKQLFERELSPISATPAATLSRAAAFDLIQRLASSYPRQATILRTELGSAWDYAVDSGRIPETSPNWWRRVLKGKIKSKGKKINGVNVGAGKRSLSEDEVGRLIVWLPNFSKLLADVLTMYLWTATRGDEITQVMGAEVVNEETGWWWIIPKDKTKNARFENATDLRVPLIGRALDVVRRRKELYGDSYLFPTTNGKITPHVSQKTISASTYFHQPYCKAAPHKKRPRLTVTHWSPHDLRRTARTILASLGCKDEVGEAILGHMPPGIVGIYNKYRYDPERREWLGRLAMHLEMLAERSAVGQPRSSVAEAVPKQGDSLPTHQSPG